MLDAERSQYGMYVMEPQHDDNDNNERVRVSMEELMMPQHSTTTVVAVAEVVERTRLEHDDWSWRKCSNFPCS
jgi:hypothetical protein